MLTFHLCLISKINICLTVFVFFSDDQNPSLNEPFDSVDADDSSEIGPQRCMYYWKNIMYVFYNAKE